LTVTASTLQVPKLALYWGFLFTLLLGCFFISFKNFVKNQLAWINLFIILPNCSDSLLSSWFIQG
jgi:hypothetical protein